MSMKRSLIKRRKRMTVSGEEVEDEEQEEEEEEEREEEPTKRKVIKSKMPRSAYASPVPAIEDYIEPRRSQLLPPPLPPPPSSSARLPPPPRTPPTFNRVLPTPELRYDPLFDYRKHTHTSTYKDLSEFDDAVTRLERVRRRIPAENHSRLSALTRSLQHIVIQAEHILSNK